MLLPNIQEKEPSSTPGCLTTSGLEHDKGGIHDTSQVNLCKMLDHTDIDNCVPTNEKMQTCSQSQKAKVCMSAVAQHQKLAKMVTHECPRMHQTMITQAYVHCAPHITANLSTIAASSTRASLTKKHQNHSSLEEAHVQTQSLLEAMSNPVFCFSFSSHMMSVMAASRDIATAAVCCVPADRGFPQLAGERCHWTAAITSKHSILSRRDCGHEICRGSGQIQLRVVLLICRRVHDDSWWDIPFVHWVHITVQVYQDSSDGSDRRGRHVGLRHAIEIDLKHHSSARLVLERVDCILECKFHHSVELVVVVNPWSRITPWVVSLHLPNRAISIWTGASRRRRAHRGDGHGQGCPRHLDRRSAGSALQVTALVL